MTGGAISPTIESPSLKPSRYRARGAGTVVSGLIVPYEIFF